MVHHAHGKKKKVLSALVLYGSRPGLYGGLSHLCVQGPDKKGQVLQVLKSLPIRLLSRRINITVQVVIESRKSFSFGGRDGRLPRQTRDWRRWRTLHFPEGRRSESGG